MVSAGHRGELTKVEIHASGTRVLTFLGGDRTMVLGGGALALYLVFVMTLRYGLIFGVPIGIVFWGVWIALLRRMTKHDPQIREVYMRHRKYKAFYPARGRFNAPSPAYKDFR
ncbi:conjugal transfer protein TrbD [Paracidovorax citrulli]